MSMARSIIKPASVPVKRVTYKKDDIPLLDPSFEIEPVSDRLFTKTSRRYITVANVREREKLRDIAKSLEKAKRSYQSELDYQQKQLAKRQQTLLGTLNKRKVKSAPAATSSSQEGKERRPYTTDHPRIIGPGPGGSPGEGYAEENLDSLPAYPVQRSMTELRKPSISMEVPRTGRRHSETPQAINIPSLSKRRGTVLTADEIRRLSQRLSQPKIITYQHDESIRNQLDSAFSSVAFAYTDQTTSRRRRHVGLSDRQVIDKIRFLNMALGTNIDDGCNMDENDETDLSKADDHLKRLMVAPPPSFPRLYEMKPRELVSKQNKTTSNPGEDWETLKYCRYLRSPARRFLRKDIPVWHPMT